MLEEGYAAATSRRVAAQAGVKPALVHYYFGGMDDLFVAVLQAGAETNLSTQQEALAEDSRCMRCGNSTARKVRRCGWNSWRWPTTARPSAARSPAAPTGSASLRSPAVASALQAHGVDTDEFPPVVMSMIVASLARILVLEQGRGIPAAAITQAQDFVRRYLDRFELLGWPAMTLLHELISAAAAGGASAPGGGDRRRHHRHFCRVRTAIRV